MIARVLTVKSTTDWNVSTGASRSSRPARASSVICRWSVRATSDDCRAPLTGNELYLNGLNSGTMPSHAAFANAGNTAGQPNTPANRARLVTPIIGERSTMRSGRARFVVGERIERVLHRERAAVRESDDVQRALRSRKPPRFPDGEARRLRPLLPFDVGESARNGAVSGQPDGDGDVAVVRVAPRDVTQAVR